VVVLEPLGDVKLQFVLPGWLETKEQPAFAFDG
jgi:hypothetical protein